MRIVKTIAALAVAALLPTTVAAQGKQPPPQPNGGSALSGATPALVIDSFTHDFGEVKAGTPLRYAFIVKNQGKADLLITNVAPG